MSDSKTIDISVIMPVYNSQEYVRDAVRSVLAQDFKNFELILVDDGSTDESGSICDALAQEDERVRVFHIPNGGMCHARNFAMRRARGTYLAFCDNDDEYLPHLLADNYDMAKREGADCVRFGRLLEVIEGEGKKPQVSYGGPDIQATYEGARIFRHYDQVRAGTGAVWAGIYRRSLVVDNAIEFDERLVRGFEDLIFNAQVFRKARVVSLNPKAYYVWRRRVSHSSSFVFDDNYLLGLSTMLEQESSLMREMHVDDYLPAYYGNHLLGALLTALGGTYYGGRTKYKEARSTYEKLREAYAPYAEDIMSHPLQATNKMVFGALMNRRYRTLYAFVCLGGFAKRVRAGLGVGKTK